MPALTHVQCHLQAMNVLQHENPAVFSAQEGAGQRSGKLFWVLLTHSQACIVRAQRASAAFGALSSNLCAHILTGGTLTGTLLQGECVGTACIYNSGLDLVIKGDDGGKLTESVNIVDRYSLDRQDLGCAAFQGRESECVKSGACSAS